MNELRPVEDLGLEAVTIEDLRVVTASRKALFRTKNLQPAATVVFAVESVFAHDLVEARLRLAAQTRQHLHAVLEMTLGAESPELPEPAEHGGIESGRDVQGAAPVQRPLQELPDQSRPRQRGMTDRDDAGVAEGRPAAHVAPLDQRDPVASPGEVVGGRDADDSGPDHNGVLSGHGRVGGLRLEA